MPVLTCTTNVHGDDIDAHLSLLKVLDRVVAFGLSESEARIYIYLLDRGSPTGGSKIAIGASTHRQYVYNILPKLIDLGLVEAVSVGKQKRYIALSPARLEKIAREKVYKTEWLITELNKFSKIGHDQESEVLVGAQQLIEHELEFLEKAQVGEEQFIIGGNAQAFVDAMGDSYDKMLEQDAKKQIHTLYIGSAKDEPTQKDYKKRRGNFITHYTDKMPSGLVHIVTRRDRVCFYSFLSPPVLHIIKSEVVAENYKQFFMMLWNMAGKKA